MIGHKWEPAEGTIINSHSEQMELPGMHGMHYVAVYEVDVRTPAGDTDRARIPSHEHTSLHPGTVIRLEINAKTGEIRMHPHRDKLIIKLGFDSPVASDDFGPAAGGLPVPGMTIGGLGAEDLAQLFGGNLPSGSPVMMTGGDAADAADLVRTMLSGNPADVAAARKRLRDIAQVQGEANRQAAANGDPVAPGRLADRPDPSRRIAVLQQMLDQGQLSHAEFEARRQRILDQI